MFDDDGNFITEYKPGDNGITEVDILNLHRIDDHEVYVNCKEIRHPEWFQPIYDAWKEKFIAEFKSMHGRLPFNDEIPSKHRLCVSIDAQVAADGEELGDCSRLEEELAVSDEDDTPYTVIRLREIIAAMPEQWQKVYKLVVLEGLSKAEAGRRIGISDVRVGQLVRKINAAIADDEELKKYFR